MILGGVHDGQYDAGVDRDVVSQGRALAARRAPRDFFLDAPSSADVPYPEYATPKQGPVRLRIRFVVNYLSFFVHFF